MVEFVNRGDNELWHDNAEWFRKCRQRLHDKFANCKSYLEWKEMSFLISAAVLFKYSAAVPSCSIRA